MDEENKTEVSQDATQVEVLTADLQRLQADFENYRKRMEGEKEMTRTQTQAATVLKLLPVIDTIDRAVAHMPAELQDNQWAQGVGGLAKQLDKILQDLGVVRIDATVGTAFHPNLHEAVQFDEAEGDQEVIAEVLRSGYIQYGEVIRPAMVRVTRQ